MRRHSQYKCFGPPDNQCKEDPEGSESKDACEADCRPKTLKCSALNVCTEDGGEADVYKCEGGKCVEEACAKVGDRCFSKDVCDAACG